MVQIIVYNKKSDSTPSNNIQLLASPFRNPPSTSVIIHIPAHFSVWNQLVISDWLKWLTIDMASHVA